MSSWCYSYEGFEPEKEGLREALCTLGNGYFATRGACAESDAGGVHYPGTYLAGGYNRLKTEMAGRIVENEDLVNLPNWLFLKFRIEDSDWFDLSSVRILSYRQWLDMRHGILHRNIRFCDPLGRETTLENRRLVHMGTPHLAAQQTVLKAGNWSGSLEIFSALDGKVKNDGVPRYRELASQHLEPVLEEVLGGGRLLLKVRTTQSKVEIAEVCHTRLFMDGTPLEPERRIVKEPGFIGETFRIELPLGSTLQIEKTVSLFTSRDTAISECGLNAGQALEKPALFEELASSHSLAWDHLWRRFEIDFNHSDPDKGDRTSRIMHLYIFHLLQTTSMHSMDLDTGVPSRGWHGEAYRGHIFWDEIYIFPLLNLRMPETTRSLLMYRYRRLDAARNIATEAGYRGAMYPWQSGSDGREETQVIHLNPVSGLWQADNSHLQRHVNAAIAYNIWQYYEVTGDLQFLSFYGAEMLLEIARFWASISTYNEELDRYEIKGVMGPDEYHDGYPGSEKPGLDNNAYTNLMAVWVLCRALELKQTLSENEWRQTCEKIDLGEEEQEKWKEISRKMRIVFQDGGIISQFEGYDRLEELDWAGYRAKYGDIQRLDRILKAEGDSPNRYKASKQADVLMLFYLFSSEELRELFQQLGYDFRYETIPDNIDYYLSRTSHGSTLSRVVHSWVLARSNRQKAWELFTEALESDVADIQGGTTPEGIHLGAMAGTADILQRVYAGVETRGEMLRFNPAIPRELGKIHMHIRYRGHALGIEITQKTLIVKDLPSTARPISLWVRGRVSELPRGGGVTLSFDL